MGVERVLRHTAFVIPHTTSSVIAQSSECIAGGVVSLNRKAPPHLVFVRAQGSHLWDADGRDFIDYHAAFAPHLLGHNHPEINAAVTRAMADGWSLVGSGTTPWEAALAKLLCTCVPGLELLQILNTGSEATANAIRLARAYTGRDDVVVTLGGYNGWHDEVGRAVMPPAAAIGPRVAAGEYSFLPISAGIPESTQRRIHIVNFNDLASVERMFQRHRVACLITEPVLQNIGIVLPAAGYLEGLRELCSRYGVVLIFDEVKTGFRTALGGYQSVARVTPDLTVFGKAVANGWPLAVLGGKREIMQRFDAAEPAKRVLIAGTYNGHPANVAAAMATLELLRRDNSAIYRQIEAQTERLLDGIGTLFRRKGREVTISRNASAFCVYFMSHVPRDWHDILEHHDFEFDRRYRLALIERGVYHFPLACKQGSVSAAHTAEDIDRTLEATESALQSL
jgi:glutamate-1-semialdehyde 2,1-aminomutase